MDARRTLPFPPRAFITPADRRQGMATSVAEGMAAQVHASFTGLGVGGNAITVGFLWMLGAGDFALGLLAAIPVLGATVQLLSAHVLPRLRRRQPWVAWASTVGRLLFVPAAALPFVLDRGPTAVAAFLGLWAVASGMASFSGNLWVSWMADLVPPRVRARFFAGRTALCTTAGILAGLVAGKVVDLHGQAHGPQSQAGAFALVFLAAGAAGAVSLWLLRRQAEPVRPPFVERRRERGLKAALVRPFLDATRTPALRGVIVFVGLFGFSNGFAAPFWQPYQLDALRMSYATVNGVLALVQGALSVAVLPLWGRISARFGDRAVVVLCVALATTHPLYYLVATPEHTWPMFCDAASAGVAWSGYNLAIFNLVLAVAAGPRLESLYAVYATVAGLAQALSSVASGIAASVMPPQVDLLGWVLDRRQVIFLATFVARLACLAVFLRAVPATRPGPVRALIVALPTMVKARMSEFKFMVGGR